MFKHLLKTITLLLVSIMFVSLLHAEETPVHQAATVSSKQSDTNTSTDNNKSDILVSNIVSHWTGDLDGMVKERLIRVLVIPSKIMYQVDKGKRSGIFYELVREFEKNINKNYPPKLKHLKTHVAFIPVLRDELIPALIEGRGDIAVADIAITPKGQKMIDFSDPFYHNVNEIVITGPSSPKINSIEDLSGKEVFVRSSSNYSEYLKQLNIRFSEIGLDPINLKSVPEQLEDEDLMEMVNAGLIGIIVVDDYKAKLWSQVLSDIVLHEAIPIKKNLTFGWMIRKNSPLLMKEINIFAKTHKEGTLFGNILLNRYVDNVKFVKCATSEKELKKFKKVVEFFQRYADKYDLNYLLMIAQGYQESHLDQKKRSPVGAIGIMQLMPATGKEMSVGSIKKEEENIHAGIKYHRWLIDHYFKNEPMDDFNKELFAFAAYNAGPGRIRGLRKAAKERGLNPNVWFNHVEILAAEKIGSETVTYVANIFKYYVAYKLIEERKKKKDEVKESLMSGS
ncbi:transglycosylase SLT domain-containing protein [Sulfurovum sp. CS9]|uniref:transglycosylase SLT domain-containing protein n=1 Tax=Sulfurovum sp. CS9 TaxID=3391146 RepID=UPI0039EB5E9F